MAMATDTQSLDELLDRLALFEPGDVPVLSLYLDARPNDNGRATFDRYLRKQLPQVARTYAQTGAARQSLEEDASRIQSWLETELRPQTRGVALFACSAQGLFEAVQLDVPFPEHRLSVGPMPHLYPLAHVADEYRRYAAVVADSTRATIWVFGLQKALDRRTVESPKSKRHKEGGWSQMHFQRHVDNARLHHIKDVADALTRVVREHDVDHVVVGADELFVPTLRAELPPEVNAKIIDILPIDIRTPEHQVLAETLESFRQEDARTDEERVRLCLDEVRGSGLGVAGLADTLTALEVGQVDELLLPATPDAILREDGTPGDASLADDLVARARRTGAHVMFVEDASVLRELGGVGALLRYRIKPDSAVPPLEGQR
jgi:peptide subunit release factor 1 (eRF1)